MRRGAAIVTGNPRYYKTSLKNGSFKCDKIEWDEAEDVYSEVMEILKALRLNNQTDIPALEGIINGWYAVRNSKKCYKQIEKLPNGLNNVYEYMSPEKMDTRHTTSPSIWEDRFKSAVENAYKAGVPVISSMGAWNKLDPTKFEVADIYKTSVCRLAKTIRYECKKRGIKHLKCVYSTEQSIKPINADNTSKPVPASISFVPSVVGLIIAGEVIKDLIK